GFATCSFQGRRPDSCRQHRHDALRDLVLHSENIFQAAIVALRPHVFAAARCIDQLNTNPNSIASAPYTAFEYVLNAKFACHVGDAYSLAAIGEGRIASDDE